MKSESLSTIFVGLAAVSVMSYAASRPGGATKPDGSDWLYVDHDLAGTRHSPLKQITTNNVSQIAKACAYSFPDKEPSQTAPIVSAGTIYLTTGCRHLQCSRRAERSHRLGLRGDLQLDGPRYRRRKYDGHCLPPPRKMSQSAHADHAISLAE